MSRSFALLGSVLLALGAVGCVPVDVSSLHHAALDLAGDAGDAITGMAVLWTFGAVLLALATQRMEALEVEVVRRPVHSAALGLVFALALGVLSIALCVTVVGIPVALMVVVLAVFAGYAGVCAVLTSVGQALAGHRTQNTYVHLALGCLVLLLLSAIPFVGEVLAIAVGLTGFGAVVATRAAGLWPESPRPA